MKLFVSIIAVMLVAALHGNMALAQTGGINETVKSEQPYTMVEHMPQYKGGNKALLSYLKLQLKKIPSSITGLAVVSFVVNEDGAISNVVLVKPLNTVINDRLIQAVEAMSGQWTPGSQNGTVVKVTKFLPVSFPLSDTSIGEVEVKPAQ